VASGEASRWRASRFSVPGGSGHNREELVFWEAENLPVEGVGPGQGMGEGPGAVGRLASVAFCPPGAKVGVRQRQFADQVGEAWFGCGASGGAYEADAHACERFPVDVAAAEISVEEEHPQEVAFLAANGREVLEDRRREVVPGEDVEVPAEDESRAVVQVVEELACLRPDAFCVSWPLVALVVLVRELVEVIALVPAKA
jgi:hypothetical protein